MYFKSVFLILLLSYDCRAFDISDNEEELNVEDIPENDEPLRVLRPEDIEDPDNIYGIIPFLNPIPLRRLLELWEDTVRDRNGGDALQSRDMSISSVSTASSSVAEGEYEPNRPISPTIITRGGLGYFPPNQRNGFKNDSITPQVNRAPVVDINSPSTSADVSLPSTSQTSDSTFPFDINATISELFDEMYGNATSSLSTLSGPEYSDDEVEDQTENRSNPDDGGNDEGIDIMKYNRAKRTYFKFSPEATENHDKKISDKGKYKNLRQYNEDVYQSCFTSTEDIIKELESFNINIDLPIWHHYTFDTGAYNREELEIEEVVAEKAFYLDRQIYEWISFKHHAVGRGDHGLSIVSSHGDNIYIQNDELNEIITSMCMFEWWKNEEKSMMIGLLTSRAATVNWYQINDDNTLINLWKWELNNPILHISIYKLDNNWKVAITHEQNGKYSRAVSIYGLDLWENWWFEEKLNGYSKPTIINDGRYLAIILEDKKTIAIYKYDYVNRRYAVFKNFVSPNVEDLTAFVVGTNSFFAIGGENPKIYDIRGSEFREIIVDDYILDHVELYLPISLGYYRDDVLLLFQHKLDHHSYSSSVIEALQWDGRKFTLLEHSPCRSHEEEMFGFSCILDAEGEKGLKGAAVLKTLNDDSQILTASEEYTPIIFSIRTRLVDLPNPLDTEVKEILEAKERIQQRFISQHRVLEEAEKILKSPDPSKAFFTAGIADNQKIKRIHAPSVYVEGDIQDSLDEDGYIDVAGKDWRNMDTTMDTYALVDQIKSDHDRIRKVVEVIKNAVAEEDKLPDQFEEITITGNIIVSGKIEVKNARIEYMNGLSVDHVLENAVKKGEEDKLVIGGRVTMENLDVESIDVELINGMKITDSSDVNFDTPIIINGDLQLNNHIHILKDVDLGNNGTINNIDIRKDIIKPNRGEQEDGGADCLQFDNVVVKDKLVAEHAVNGYDFTEEGFEKLFEIKRQLDDKNMMNKEDMMLDTMTVTENLFFENINGRSWKEYLNGLIMTNKNADIDNIDIGGLITVGRDLSMEILNNLSFPDDYVLINDSSPSVITASKTFANDLQVDEVDCENTISGIVPEDIVTLSTRQNLKNFSFFDLTVTERLNVQGDVTGKELDDFLSNPILSEVREIKSNVIFRRLIVNGTLNVSGKVNGSDWNQLFDGIIMKSSDPVTIDSFKTFEGHVFMRDDLNVRSGFLNNRRVSDFLTTDTEQIISNNILNGNIVFGDLNVGGLFDDVNITDLNENSVRLNGNQTVMSNMIFDDPIDDYDDPSTRSLSPVDADELRVVQSCNDWAVPDDALFVDDETFELDSPRFDNLYVEELIVEGDLKTSGSISGVNLYDFDRVRLSKSKKKEVTAPYTISNCVAKSLDFRVLNGISKKEMNLFDEKMKNIVNEVLSSNVGIDTLHVNGNLNVSIINGINLYEIAENAVWIKEDSFIDGHTKFMENISTDSLYLKNNAYGVNFEQFINDIVQVYENPITITGKKTYLSGLVISENISTEYINEHKVSNILNAFDDQFIDGNLYVDNLEVTNNLNVHGIVQGLNMMAISESFEYLENDVYHIKGDVTFKDDISVNNLIVNGFINDRYDLKNTLDYAAYTSEDNYFNNTMVFLKPVTIKDNFDIYETYNGVKVQYILNNIVTTDADAFVNSTVVFKQPLIVEGKLQVDGDLVCDKIQDCYVDEWKNNAIYLDQWQTITGMKRFENLTIMGNAAIKNINERNFNNFVTLNNDQTIYGGLKFNRLFNNRVDVDGYVNNVNIKDAFENTLMVNTEQRISSLLNFHSNVIISDNAIIGKINNKNINKALKLDSDQILESQYNFHGDIGFKNNINISGDISNINFDLWMKNALFKNNFGDHQIKGDWNIYGNLIFEDDISGMGKIDELSIQDFEEYLRYKDYIKTSNENYFKNQYQELCNVINNMKDLSLKKGYFFKDIEEIQSISNTDFRSVHQLAYDNENFLIISNKWNCFGYLWKWKSTLNMFDKFDRVEVGCPTKWYNIYSKASFYLLSTNSKNCECKISGTTIWSFDGINMEHVKKMNSIDSIYVSPFDDGSFYAIENNELNYYQLEINNDLLNIVKTLIQPNVGTNVKLIPNIGLDDVIITDGKKLLKYEKYSTSNKFSAVATNNNKLSMASEIIMFNVGKYQKTIFAVTQYTMNNDSNENEITIYENLLNGVVLQKVKCTNPSSLISIELENYQTLFLFIENHESIELYSYHGFQGFKHIYSLSIPATRIDNIVLNYNDTIVKGLLIVKDGIISVSKINMYGHRINFQKTECE